MAFPNIPQVSMNWCHHTAKCKWCEKAIEPTNPMVSVFFWNRRKESTSNQIWNTKLYYHPQCWVDQGLDYLRLNPYVSNQRWDLSTRKTNPLTNEQREHRLALLRRKAALDQRLRNLKSPYPSRTIHEARIGASIANIMVEILEYGGVPKKWLR